MEDITVKFDEFKSRLEKFNEEIGNEFEVRYDRDRHILCIETYSGDSYEIMYIQRPVLEISISLDYDWEIILYKMVMDFVNLII